MSNIPNIPSNKKCWMIINRLVFGDNVCCPKCQAMLQEKYTRRYLWCRECRKKYRATSYRGGWLFGMKLSPRQLFILLWCWQQRKSLESTLLKAEVSHPTAARWFTRFRDNVPDTTPLLEGLVQADESYFGKQKSKQPTHIVTGAIEPGGGKLALRITGDHITGRSQKVIERFIIDTVKPGSLVVTDKWYAYNDLPFLGYEHESHNHSKGDYSNTNDAERIWSIAKRHMRKLYGQRILTHQLEDLCREWMARTNKPELFTDPFTFLRFTLSVPC